MDFELTEEQKMLRSSARSFLAERCPKSLVRQMEKDTQGLPRDLWGQLARLGWLGLAFPSQYGGSGASFLDLVVLEEEIGRALLPGPFFATVVLGGMTVLEAGDEAQKKNILPAIAAGRLVLSLALHENGLSYDLNSTKTTAAAGKDGYVIDGTKLFVPDAQVADRIICLARTAEGLSLFLVDSSSAGLHTTLLHTIGGDKQCEMSFDGVRVPGHNLLGTQGKGGDYLAGPLQKATIARCAEMVGQMQQVLEMTVAYAKVRIQFGVPIGSFQAVQHHCANMLIDVDGMRFITYKAAWLISEGRPCAKEVAAAKVWCNESIKRVTTLAHQVHGGVGLMDDHDLTLFTRRSLGERSGLGSSDWHRLAVARAALARS